MTHLIISIPDDQAEKLSEAAAAQGLTLEQLAYTKLMEALSIPLEQVEDRIATEEEFQNSARRIFDKNVELRRRLA